MSVNYGVLLYDSSYRYLTRLPVVGVDAGLVVNDIGKAKVEVIPNKRVYLDDVAAFVVMRYDAGRPTMVGTYFVQQAVERVDNHRRTWPLQGETSLCLLQQRYTGNITTALTGASALSMRLLIDSAWRQGDTPATVNATRADICSPNATTQTGYLETLATLRDVARASETAYGFDLRVKVNYDIVVVPAGNALVFRPVVWVGEYGADRRVGCGVQPVLLYLPKVASTWTVTDDRSRQVTHIIGTGNASSYSNMRALESPFGNRREKTASGSSTGASRVNAQSRTNIYDGRQVTRIQTDLELALDKHTLGLGDVFTVNVNGTAADAWLNVIQYQWGPTGEKVMGRIDVEIQKWT